MRPNKSSGLKGVSWHRQSEKWVAYVGNGPTRKYLGLFPTTKAACQAVATASALLPISRNTIESRQSNVIDKARRIYARQGLSGLTGAALEHKGLDYGVLRRVGLNHVQLLEALDIKEDYIRWRASARTYRGKASPPWTWERALQVAKELADKEGDLPTVEWCRCNGYSSLTNAVFKSAHTWEDLRASMGLPTSASFFSSRNGQRWRSRAEACLSNFLYARGIEHKRGERYDAGYAESSGRMHGRYDLHFRLAAGDWINVEVWGNLAGRHFGKRYAETRAKKEAFHFNASNFLGIDYLDCQKDKTLAETLRPFIGDIKPFVFDYIRDTGIETAHWSSSDELLTSCRELAAQMPDGKFPSDSWLRKEGKHAERTGPIYNTMSVRINQWLGGTRKVRELLGQAHASTNRWTKEAVVAAWRDFEARTGFTPAQCKGALTSSSIPTEVRREGCRIYQAAHRLDAIGIARQGIMCRKTKWTPANVVIAWREFSSAHGLTPSQAMGAANRRRLRRDISALGANIYNTARRLGVLRLV